MPTDKAVIFHVGPVQGVQTDALPEGAAIVADRPDSVDDNVRLYLAAYENVNRQSRPVPIGPHLAILAVGPVLDSPDDAAFVDLAQHGHDLELDMAYTSAVAEGKVLKRNVPWRPLVQVPSAGRGPLSSERELAGPEILARRGGVARRQFRSVP